MTKKEFWNICCNRNDSWIHKDVIHISSKALKAMFDQTWEQAVKHQQEVSKTYSDNSHNGSNMLDQIKKTYGGGN